MSTLAHSAAQASPGPAETPTALDSLRSTARVLKVLDQPEWIRTRVLAGIVAEHALVIAIQLLNEDGSK